MFFLEILNICINNILYGYIYIYTYIYIYIYVCVWQIFVISNVEIHIYVYICMYVSPQHYDLGIVPNIFAELSVIS